MVSWETLSETESDYFVVERSPDGISFSELTRIAGAGNSIDPIGYSYFDAMPLFGLNYYRIKIADLNGEYHYSIIAVVKFQTRLPSFTIQPNLATNLISLKLSKETDQFSQVEVFDLSGKMVLRKALDAYQFTHDLDVSYLSPAQYITVLRVGNDFFFDRFVKF